MHWWVKEKIEIFIGSRISKFLRPAQRYDDFKLIGITCQAACHGKTEHGIFVKFKKPSKTAVVLIAGVIVKFKKLSSLKTWQSQAKSSKMSSLKNCQV